MTHNVVIIPGDGIGPEISFAVLKILEAAKANINFIESPAGMHALEEGHDSPLPQVTLDLIKEHKVAIKGPCTTPEDV